MGDSTTRPSFLFCDVLPGDDVVLKLCAMPHTRVGGVGMLQLAVASVVREAAAGSEDIPAAEVLADIPLVVDAAF